MHACSRKYIDFPLVWWPCNLHFFLLPSFLYCLPSNISILAIKNTGYCYISFLVLLCKYFKEIIYVYRFSSFRSEFQYMYVSQTFGFTEQDQDNNNQYTFFSFLQKVVYIIIIMQSKHTFIILTILEYDITSSFYSRLRIILLLY